MQQDLRSPLFIGQDLSLGASNLPLNAVLVKRAEELL